MYKLNQSAICFILGSHFTCKQHVKKFSRTDIDLKGMSRLMVGAWKLWLVRIALSPKHSDSGLESSFSFLRRFRHCSRTGFHLDVCPSRFARAWDVGFLMLRQIYIFGLFWGRMIGGFVLGTILLRNIANVGSFHHNSINFLHVWAEGRHFQITRSVNNASQKNWKFCPENWANLARMAAISNHVISRNSAGCCVPMHCAFGPCFESKMYIIYDSEPKGVFADNANWLKFFLLRFVLRFPRQVFVKYDS